MRRYLTIGAALVATSISVTTSIPAGAEDATPAQIALAPGGLRAASPRQLIRENPLAYPKRIVPQDLDASVLLSYAIEPDGRVDRIEVLKGSTAPFNIEAERTVASRLYAPAASATPGARTLVQFHAAP